MDAEIVVLPGATPCACPTEFTVATEFVEELHVTWRVMSSDEPSLKLPLAVKDWFDPAGIDALDGVNVIDVRVALLTVNVACPTTPENTAEIVVFPG